MRKHNSPSKKFEVLRDQAEALLHSTVKENEAFSGANVLELIHELDVHQVELQMQNDELQQALLQLEASQIRYFELYEFSSVGYLSLDENKRIVEANFAATDLLGVEKIELMNKPFSDYIDMHDQDVFFLHYRKSLSTKTRQNCELKLNKKDGTEFYAHLESSVAVHSAVDSHQLHISIIDISLRKQAEEHLRLRQFESKQAEKITSLGTLASALAHELTQPIAAANNFISGCIWRLEGGTDSKKAVLAAMKKANQQMERAGKIIHSMKDSVFKKQLCYEIIDVNKVIKDAVCLIKEEPYPMRIKISVHLLPVQALLLADNIQIEQVLINLMRNSIEAMVDAQVDQPQLMIKAIQMNNNFIKISVSDKGPGISVEILEKIFEPLFTTKTHGLGMGLAICHNIVTAHDGELCAKNNNKEGACFELTLPIAEV